MEVTAPGRILTQAARRASTTARAIRRASAGLEHVTRTTNLSVKRSSQSVHSSVGFSLRGLDLASATSKPRRLKPTLQAEAYATPLLFLAVRVSLCWKLALQATMLRRKRNYFFSR